MEVSVDTEACPGVEFLVDEIACRPRRQAEGMAAEVDQGLAVSAGRQMKLVAIGAQRILLIQVEGKGFVGRELHVIQTKRARVHENESRCQCFHACLKNRTQLPYMMPS